MNKYQKSLNYIKNSFIPDLDILSSVELAKPFYKTAKEALNNLDELIDKATPKKPIYEDLDCYLACPNCWNNIDDLSSVFTDELIQPKYCPRCGQHIDWSKDE